jgi:hypothetical protein
MSALLRPVDPAQLPDYPFERGERLDSHWFMPWSRRRWLNSDMRLRATPECRAYYFDLICISFDHTPVGTLPHDADLLARMLMVDPTHFKALVHLPYGPLHNWRPCNCGGEVRLMHETVVETLTDAIARKEDNRARTEAANTSKRLARVRQNLASMNIEWAANDAAVLWFDRWFEEREIRKRTPEKYRAAAEAFVAHMRGREGRAR